MRSSDMRWQSALLVEYYAQNDGLEQYSKVLLKGIKIIKLVIEYRGEYSENHQKYEMCGYLYGWPCNKLKVQNHLVT